MNWLRPTTVAAAVLFAGCSGSDGPTTPSEPVVASVTVTPASSTLEAVGATVQLTATAKDASGSAVTGKTVTWTTSDAGIATVGMSGLVSAVSPGTAAITATVSGVAGSAVITVSQPKVAIVEVTPSSATLAAVGATVQLTVTAKTSSGTVVTGQTVSWASTNNAIVAVSASGLATGVTPGTATVTATVGGVVGSSVITVKAPCASPTTVTLSAGQAASYDPSSCLLIPSGASGDRYRVVVLRPTETADASDVATATLQVVGLGVSQAAPEPAPAPAAAQPVSDIPGLSTEALRRALRVADATERFHVALREQERRLLATHGARGLARTRRPSGPAAVAALATSPSKLTLDLGSKGSSCTTSDANKKTVLLIHETDDLVVYQDSAQSTTKPITSALAQQMTSYYANYTKQMIRSYFGAPSDIDGNGKVLIVVSPIVTGDVAAFVWSGDFFDNDPSNPNRCAASNEREIIYFNADLVLLMNNGEYQALETIAHEMKHMVSLYNRIAASLRIGTAQYHPTWIEEGTAEISGEMSSRIAWAAIGGPAVNAEVNGQRFRDTGSAGGMVKPEAYGVALKLARTAWYLASQPNGLVVTPTGAQDGSSVYGSGWLFHRWLGDAFGNAAGAPQRDSSLFRALNDSLAGSGTTGLAQQTGRSFLELLDEFTKTVSLHKTTAPSPALNFTTYDLVSGAEIFCSPNPVGVFPWPVTTTGTPIDCNASPRINESSNPSASFATKTYTGPIGATGMRIHDFVSNGTGTGAQIQLDVAAPAKIWVVRLR